MKLKEDILSCSFSELSFGLCQFIQEVRRPNGEKYDPDSILYLCLGIQQVILLPRAIFFVTFLYLQFGEPSTEGLVDPAETNLPALCKLHLSPVLFPTSVQMVGSLLLKS